MTSSASPDVGVRREVLRLAVPAFFALVSEPLFLLADTAIVGHLGTPQLAGLGIAASVLATVVSLCIFLAYGTTGSVARLVGAGDERSALAQGIDGVWLAVLIGVPVTAVLLPGARAVVGLFGAGEEVADLAVQYLQLALLGVTPMLVVLAATGVLRGLQDTRTPLVVAVTANLLNVALNVALVYGVAGLVPALGIRGSALGTVIAQLAGAIALLLVVVRAAGRASARVRPSLGGVRRAARAGVPLLLRTLTLRAALVLMTYAAARLGAEHAGGSATGRPEGTELATMQLALTIWGFLVFVLDAVAIAAQAMTGRRLGAGDTAAARSMTTLLTRWGLLSGIVTGGLLAAASPVLGPLFTEDPAVRSALVPCLLVAAAAQPVAGVVFVLDGVLIGAGDGRYLAATGLLVLIVFVPAAAVATALGGTLAWLWVAFGLAFMGGRAVVLLSRARGEQWMRLGA